MSYNKTTWVEKETIITADAMNNIENGIESVSNQVIANESSLNEVNTKLDAKAATEYVDAELKKKADAHEHPYANASHTHNKSEIVDFPESLPANGGNADTVNGKTVEVNVPADAKFTDTIYVHPNDENTRHITDAERAKLTSIEDGANKTILNNTVTSTSTTQAATANAVKIAYDKANHSHPYLSSSPESVSFNFSTGYSKLSFDNTNRCFKIYYFNKDNGYQETRNYYIPIQDKPTSDSSPVSYNISLENNWEFHSNFGSGNAIRKIGNVVHVCTTLTNGNREGIIGTVPTECRPKYNKAAMVSFYLGPQQYYSVGVIITTAGQIQIMDKIESTSMVFLDFTYFVD